MPYDCKDCGFSTPSRRTYAKHRREHRDWLCYQCGADFKTIKQYTEHMHTVHEDFKPFQCKVCPSSFPSMSGLRHHDTQTHQPHAYVCSECDYTGAIPSIVAAHFRVVHTDQRPHKCPHCDYRAKSAPVLANHVRIHGPRTFACPKCPFKARQPAGLRHHLITHCTCGVSACPIHA